jgi:excisionase family DNA binding protein
MYRRNGRNSTALTDAKMLLSVDEAAGALSLGRTRMYELVMKGDIASLKLGRTRRIPVAALREYVSRQLEVQ